MSRDLAAIISICLLGVGILAITIFIPDVKSDVLTVVLPALTSIITGLFAIIKNIPRPPAIAPKEKLKQEK